MCIFQAPIGTRSGYGEMCRGIARHLIELDLFDLKFIPVAWGATPQNALDGTDPLHQQMISRILPPNTQLQKQPEVFIHGVIPNEFMNPAKINIGITAGIETNMCSEQWLVGCNRMTTVWGISNHAVRSLKDTLVTKQDNNGNVVEQVKANVPFEVLHNYIDTAVFKKISSKEIPESVSTMMEEVKEGFCFLFVGHWVKGGFGEDRKNIGVLIKTFGETFKSTSSTNKPALILKTSGADFSIMDREEILKKISDVKQQIGPHCPNIYLIHGDLTEPEMNGLYNHPKVKVHISFTKGEGFGRPLLEATQSEKPIIASGWSGHLDFLNPQDAILLSGELRQIEPGAVWENILIPQSSWFNVDINFAEKAMKLVFKDYDKFLPGAKRLAKSNAEKFNSEAIKKITEDLLRKYIPESIWNVPQIVTPTLPPGIKLPQLNTSNPSKIELPKLKIVQPEKKE